MTAISDLISGDFHVGAYRQKAGTVSIPGNLAVSGDLDASGSSFSADTQYELVAAAKTLDDGDNGVVQRVTATATVTLPATVVGTSYTVEVGAPGITVTVAPNASDQIYGNGMTSAANKAIISTNGNKGDRITLIGDGVNGWMLTEVRGTWTRAA